MNPTKRPRFKRTVDTYNRLGASIHSRLLPGARRMRELGATASPDIEESNPIDTTPRVLELPEEKVGREGTEG